VVAEMMTGDRRRAAARDAGRNALLTTHTGGAKVA
jgi:hypothetical protein